MSADTCGCSLGSQCRSSRHYKKKKPIQEKAEGGLSANRKRQGGEAILLAQKGKSRRRRNNIVNTSTYTGEPVEPAGDWAGDEECMALYWGQYRLGPIMLGLERNGSEARGAAE